MSVNCESIELSIDVCGVSRGVPACADGNYYQKDTIIPLVVDLSKYKFLYFVCGEDTETAGLKTLVIPLHTEQSYFRLTWDINDSVLRPVSILFKYVTITIDEEIGRVVIRDTNVDDYGIRKIIAG